MSKVLVIEIKALEYNTPQTFKFIGPVSGLEQLAFWMLVKKLAEDNIEKLFTPKP